MSGIKKTVEKAVNASTGHGWKTNKKRRQRTADANAKIALDKTYANALRPDPEEIQRIERRKQAKRRGSRVSTVLTNQETLG